MNLVSRLEAVLVERTGLLLHTLAPPDAVERLVGERLAALHLPDEGAYLDAVTADPLGDAEFGRLLSALTNTHTSFFRHRAQFALLRSLLEARNRRRVAIWSATCATGEEAYSLGMLAAELNIEAEVLGSDINGAALATARRGRYSRWALRKLPATYAERYMEPSEGQQRVADPLRSRVTWRQHNILSPTPPRPRHGGRWDLILCRNTFIYFAPDAIEAAARHFADVIAPDGWLLVGAAESLQALDVPWRAEFMGDAQAYAPVAHALAWSAPAAAPAPPRDRGRLDLRHAPFWSASPQAEQPAPAAAPPPPAARPRAGGRRVVISTQAPRAAARPERSPELDAALACLAEGRPEDADAALARHVAARPHDHAARLLHGNVALARHDFPAALRHYDAVTAALPLSAEAALLAGLAYRKLGDMARARDQLRRALFLDDTCWPAAFLLAGVYDRLDEGPRRLAMLRTALEILTAGPPPLTWSAPTAGIEELTLDPQRVAELCRRGLQSAE